jgi:hypothetical protein
MRSQIANLPQKGEHRSTRAAIVFLTNPKRTGLGCRTEVPFRAPDM